MAQLTPDSLIINFCRKANQLMDDPTIYELINLMIKRMLTRQNGLKDIMRETLIRLAKR
jgi:hypothetical protein